MLNEHETLGQDILEHLFKALMIDESWALREPRGFTWWAHRLAQRVWVEPLPEFREPPVVRVQAETALLRHVPDTMANRARLDVMNKVASLNTYRFDPQTGRLALRCCAYVTTETVPWLKSFLSAAIAIQVADAHIKGQAGLAKLFDADLDISAHLSRGPRHAMDDMLNVIDAMFEPMGRKRSPFTEADFEGLQHVTPNPSVLTTTGLNGATAEFPFTDEMPAVLCVLSSKRKRLGTALCQISATCHPQLGNGAFWKLTLPLDFAEREAIDKAIDLNLAEYDESTWPYFYGFGAWCSDPKLRAVAYVMFMPAAVHKPGILNPFFWSMRARTEWVKRYLFGECDRQGTA
jgi:hypothetical protein